MAAATSGSSLIGDLRPAADDGDAAPEAPVRLRQLEAHVPRPEHDQVGRDPAELQRLDAGERRGGRQAGDVEDRGVCPQVDEHAIGRQHAGAAARGHLEGPGRDEPSRAHDQLGTARPVAIQVLGDLRLDHVALALPHARHVDRRGAGHRPELCRAADQRGHLGAPDLVLAREAVDVGARAADVAALHHGRAPTGLGQVPGQVLARRAAAEDEDVEPFGRHAGLLVIPMASSPPAGRAPGAR